MARMTSRWDPVGLASAATVAGLGAGDEDAAGVAGAEGATATGSGARGVTLEACTLSRAGPLSPR